MKALALIPLLVACGGDPAKPDAPLVIQDGSPDVGHDAHPDAPIDAPATVTRGQLEVAQGSSSGMAEAEATAQFGTMSPFGSVAGTDGPCTIYNAVQQSPARFSAGTVTITGTVSTITLNPSGAAPDVTYSPAATVPKPAFTAGATITFTGGGGPDLGAFTASVTAPATLTGYTPPTTISRAGYTATWTAGTGPTIWVILAAIDSNAGTGHDAICIVDDTGSFTVPSTTFAMFGASETEGYVGIGRVSPMTVAVGSAMVDVQATSFITSGQVTITN